MKLNFGSNPYSSQRQPAFGRYGTVATSQALAAQAGMQILRAGGNAVDAAIATAACLTVVEPTSNGIGGDAFALVWDGNKLHGLNASGRAPQNLTKSLLEQKGYTTMPQDGWLSVTIPGVPAAWRDLHQKFGRLPFEQLLESAIDYAENGFIVSSTVARFWAYAARKYGSLEGQEFKPWQNTFTRDHLSPKAGERFYLPDHAKTLRRIAETHSEDFYTGSLAKAIEDFAAQTGGVITQADLRTHTNTWVDPISTNYRGYDIWEIPPNGQGIATLSALNILEGFDLSRYPRDSIDSYHLQLEAMKLGFADTLAYVADPTRAEVPITGLLSKAYAAERRALIGETALLPSAGQPPKGGTVYLCTADSDGMMVSYIQSNYAGFGSGIVIPNTGIALQNRGANFNLEPNHPNCLEPNKRPYHTIIPGFLSKDNQAVGPFGVMGGFMQPQGHLQMMINTIDYGLHPQAALDAPRWQWLEERKIELETHTPRHIAEGLRAKGHQVTMQLENGNFGRGQIIWKIGDAFVAGTESRCDGAALVY
jgi:gamma-glutamyltranspeptidase / glutathione hydrolase